jgi:hypothetical protein
MQVAAQRCAINCDAYHVSMRGAFIVIGLLIVAIGVLWPWLSKLPIGRLPGDIVVDRPGFKFFFPLTTMIIVSVVVSLLLWLFRK